MHLLGRAGDKLALHQIMGIREPVLNNVLLGTMDLRTKLEVLLPLAFEKRVNDVCYAQLETTVNLINNDLRSERNRIIHDTFFQWPGANETHPMHLRGKVINVQSRTKEIKLADNKPFGPRDVGLLYVRMIRASQALSRLMFELKTYRPSTDLPAAPRPE